MRQTTTKAEETRRKIRLDDGVNVVAQCPLNVMGDTDKKVSERWSTYDAGAKEVYGAWKCWKSCREKDDWFDTIRVWGNGRVRGGAVQGQRSEAVKMGEKEDARKRDTGEHDVAERGLSRQGKLMHSDRHNAGRAERFCLTDLA